MKTFRSTTPRSSLLCLLAIVAALALAACGDDGGGGDEGGEPSTLAPAETPLYFEATVRPEGEQKDELLSALGKILNSDDPGGMIREALEESTSDDGLTYAEDIEPWLGQRAGVFLDDVTASEPDGAAILAVTDEGAAQDAIQKAADADEASEEERTYEGVTYQVDSDDDAVGIVDGFLVAGTEAGFKAAVDAGAGEALADNSEAADALDSAPDNSIFTTYVDVAAVLDLVVESGEISQKDLEAVGGSQLEALREGAVVVSGAATADAFSIEVSAPAAEAGEQTDIISSLPSDSWLALGAPMVGESISMGYQELVASLQSGLGDLPGGQLPGGEFPDVQGEVESALGIDLAEDLSWAGDLGLFVQGSSIFDLGGGLVIETDDEDAASATVDKLAKALSKQPDVQVSPTADGFEAQLGPAGAEVAVSDGKLAIGFAGTTVEEVLNPGEPLGDEAGFQSAGDQLGDDLTAAFYVDFPTVVALIEGSGATDPSFQQAKPYLDALSYLVAGSGSDGDRSIARVVLGVQEGSSSSDAPAASITP